MIRHTTAAAALFLSALVWTPALAADKAEFALRWSDGGPGGAEEIVKVLNLAGKQKAALYSVQYYELPSPAVAAPGAAISGRTRSRDDGKFELSFKARATTPFPGFPSNDNWVCPLDGGKKKSEVDVTLDKTGQPVRAYSRSCELEGTPELRFPPALNAKARGCVNQMKRISIGAVKVEEWQMPGAAKLTEVSMTGEDTAQDLERFRQLVSPLLKMKLAIADGSKTEAGSDCR
jgi:hypothetical protein